MLLVNSGLAFKHDHADAFGNTVLILHSRSFRCLWKTEVVSRSSIQNEAFRYYLNHHVTWCEGFASKVGHDIVIQQP